jgi:phage-related minor tail protein
LEQEKKNPNSAKYNSAKNRYNTAQQGYNTAKTERDKEAKKEYPSSSVLNRKQSLMNSYRGQMNTARTDMATARREWENSKQTEIDKISEQKSTKEAEKKKKDENYTTTLNSQLVDKQQSQSAAEARMTSENIKKEQMEKGNRFILNFQILEYAVWQRDKEGNLTDFTQLCFLWLIRLLFFIIEILPTVVKIVTPVGSYDRVVFAEEKSMAEYLSSSEFIDSMKEIHDAELHTQLEETRLKQKAELQMKKDILDKITTAQVAVANKAIEEWEKAELKKYAVVTPHTSESVPTSISDSTVIDDVIDTDSSTDISTPHIS